MKSVVFIAAALAVDLRRRGAPLTALTVGAAYALASLVSALTKDAVGRERPRGEHLIALPDTASFPSGHATTAFAAAVALGLLVPAARWWALALAALISWSRVELGVHYWSDVVGGALIGTLVAVLVVAVARRAGATRRRSGLAARPRTRPR